MPMDNWYLCSTANLYITSTYFHIGFSIGMIVIRCLAQLVPAAALLRDLLQGGQLGLQLRPIPQDHAVPRSAGSKASLRGLWGPRMCCEHLWCT